MNVYICIRLILHSLLFLVNILSLTVASLTIVALKGQGHEVGAILTTVDASKGTCRGQASCVALLIVSWMSALTLLVYYLIVMTVTLYHFVSNENIWSESPLGYNWFPLPPSESVLPAVPPKDTDTNTTPNLPMDTNRPPSVDIDIEIASIEPPPPRLQNGHRRKVSSWKPAPLDADGKAGSTSAASGSQLGLPSDVPSGPLDSTEALEDIPIGQPSRLPEPEITPKFSLNGYIARMSFGGPEWAKKLRPKKPGVDLPFPVVTKGSVKRYPIPIKNQSGMERIDAPVSPTSFRE
ncbi:hypothetical protein Clacol_004911 [Clathrus columnatus]|uniref:Uncharacterized protein n=1 Tax=Clathrus columnatus TaxID=1419009 RepID=A0AAV5ABU2_9AGAM|nr:hypothetical protein Clacol_004911 [Clathrus columnatus]